MLVAVAMATVFAIYNATFWAVWAEVFAGNFIRGLGFAAAFFFLCCALLGGLAFRSVLRPLIAALFVLSAVTSFYMDRLGVVILKSEGVLAPLPVADDSQAMVVGAARLLGVEDQEPATILTETVGGVGCGVPASRGFVGGGFLVAGPKEAAQKTGQKGLAQGRAHDGHGR